LQASTHNEKSLHIIGYKSRIKCYVSFVGFVLNTNGILVQVLEVNLQFGKLEIGFFMLL